MSESLPAMKILIADDERVSRTLLKAALTKLGHEVVDVDNGIDAIRVLLEPDGPRLAILDWMMPGADGLTVCATVRERAIRLRLRHPADGARSTDRHG